MQKLNCRDDAKRCPYCFANQTAMVTGTGSNAGKAAVACFECGLRGPHKATMHAAVIAWNALPPDVVWHAASEEVKAPEKE